MKVEIGVMLMKDGKGWGTTYRDGHCTQSGWINVEDAPIHKPEFCKEPKDVTYSGSPYTDEINTGNLVMVERITVVKKLKGTEVLAIVRTP